MVFYKVKRKTSIRHQENVIVRKYVKFAKTALAFKEIKIQLLIKESKDSNTIHFDTIN